MNQRIKFIDVTRGMAMLLVIFGHCFITETVLLNRYILSFHMALFFLVSGMFIKPTFSKELLIGGGKKARSILIPQIAVVLLASMRPIAHHFVNGSEVDYLKQFSFFSVWFLPVLFFCVATFLIIGCVINLNKIKNKILCLSISLIIVPFAVYANRYGFTGFLHCVLILPVAFTFYMLGNILKRSITLLERHHNNKMGMLAIAAVGFGALVAYTNSPVDFYRNSYGNLLLFYIGAVLGCFALLYLGSFLTSSKLCKYIGKNSIAFYVWNFTLPWMAINACRPMLSIIGVESPTILAFVSFAVALPIFFMIVKITLKFIPWMYGLSTSKNGIH